MVVSRYRHELFIYFISFYIWHFGGYLQAQDNRRNPLLFLRSITSYKWCDVITGHLVLVTEPALQAILGRDWSKFNHTVYSLYLFMYTYQTILISIMMQLLLRDLLNVKLNHDVLQSQHVLLATRAGISN